MEISEAAGDLWMGNLQFRTGDAGPGDSEGSSDGGGGGGGVPGAMGGGGIQNKAGQKGSAATSRLTLCCRRSLRMETASWF